jgi:hypothetical protein
VRSPRIDVGAVRVPRKRTAGSLVAPRAGASLRHAVGLAAPTERGEAPSTTARSSDLSPLQGGDPSPGTRASRTAHRRPGRGGGRRDRTKQARRTGALGAGEYALASTVSAASESVEVRKLGNPGGAAAEPVLGRIFRAGTALPQFVPDTSSPLGFMPSLAILKLVAAGYFLGGGREGAGDVYVVFPDDLPLEHPNAHASIGRDAGASSE